MEVEIDSEAPEPAGKPKKEPKAGDTSPRDPSLAYGLRRSLFVHAALISFVILKSLFFPSSEKPYMPALKVDVVDLPDLLKMEKMKIGSLPEPEPPPADEEEKAPEAEEEPPPEKDEMALAQKKALDEKKKKEEEERRKKEEKLREEELEKKRRKNMSSALARIKALNKITETPLDAPEQMKGNKLSAGAALEGGKESDQPSYYDLVHQRVKENWELPVWLDRMQLSAKVRVTIDSRGNVRSMIFAKTSGNPQFDQAVKDAITDSQPFPVPPAEQAGEMISNGILLGFPM